MRNAKLELPARRVAKEVENLIVKNIAAEIVLIKNFKVNLMIFSIHLQLLIIVIFIERYFLENLPGKMTVESLYDAYCQFKEAFIRRGLNKYELAHLKDIVRDMIDSVRRLEGLKSIADIIDCLEREDFISEYDTEVLIRLAESLFILNNEETGSLREAIRNYQQCHLSNVNNVASSGNRMIGTNLYRLKRPFHEHSIANGKGSCGDNSPQDEAEEHIKNKKKCNIAVNDNSEKYASIRKLIATNIGQEYRNFARELNISEPILDELNLKYPNDLQSRLYKILDIFEQNSKNSSFSQRLCQINYALEGCRRKDLCRQIRQILNTD